MNYYVYIYLNPLKKGKFKTSNGIFEYEPIYVGKGCNNRIYHHISEKFLSINNHRYNLLNKIIKTIGINEYKSNYILKIKDNLTENDSLLLEYNIMYELGTYYDIHPLIKRGPLLNFTLCGVKNPIMYGKNNPMYNKSFYDVWKEKYPIKIFNEMIKDHTELLSKNTKQYWDTLKLNKKDYSDVCFNIKNGVNTYWSNLTKDEYNNVIEKRSINFKNFYKLHNSFKEFYIKKHGLEEGMRREKTRRKKISKSVSEFWSNMDPEKKKEHSLKTKVGLYKFIKEYKTVDNYIKLKFGEEYYNTWKKEILLNQSKSQKERWRNMSDEEIFNHSIKLKNAWKNKNDIDLLNHRNKYVGEKNPMFNNGFKVSGNKNGRSTQWIIHIPNGEKYYCDGSFKRFCSDILRKYKPQPHRKYLTEIIKNDSPVDGWYFKKVDRNFNTKNYIIYE